MSIKQTKAIGVEEAGGADKLKIVTLTLPELKERDLLVKILAVSLNPVDYKKRSTGMGHQGAQSAQNPIILGFDAVGIVVNKGKNTKFYNVNDKVFYSGDLTRYGTNSEYHVIDERIVGKMPKTISDAQGAAYPLVTLTAWEGLECQMKIKPNSQDKSILVIGGAGGVGSMIIQLAKVVFGLQVIATASRQETIDHCKKLGADYVINHYKNLADQFKEQKIDNVDYVFCTPDLTSSTILAISQIIKPFGYLCTITGSHLGALDINPLKGKSAKIVHELMFTRSMFQVDMEKQKEILDKLSELIDNKKIQSICSNEVVFNLENLKQEHEKITEGKNIGKVVLYDVDKYFQKK